MSTVLAWPVEAMTNQPSPTRERRAAILGMGSSLPAALLTNADLEQMVDTSDTWIMERTGIRSRHRATTETTASLGADAARRALENAGNPRIDAIVTATCTPDAPIPSMSCRIQEALDLPPMPCFDLNAACSGYIYGMTVSSALVTQGLAENVLFIAAERLTSLLDFTDRSTCVLFGDGAAATILGARDRGGIRATHWSANGNEGQLIYFGTSETRPDRPPAVHMAGKGTFRLAVERLSESIITVCEKAGWTIDDVDHLVPHQANARIIEAVAKRLQFPREKVICNVDHVGNTSAASIPIALTEAHNAGELHDGARIVCAAFGSGSTWGGIALEWGS